jgi:polyphenol oxidase
LKEDVKIVLKERYGMEKVDFKNYEYISIEDGKANIAFFTAKGDLNFNINSTEGIGNIKYIKEEFNLKDIGYLTQIHSDVIYHYNGQRAEGDALITDEKNIGIGVFTADCVPIMVYDRKREIIAAVHSGWKGTYTEIAAKTIDRMCKDFGSEAVDIAVYIGPHNMQCCYEIGAEVSEKFEEQELYKGIPILADNKLSMEKCIIKQCLERGVLEENIKATGICTFCNDEFELYSYRKDNLTKGRMFSLIFLRD